MSQLVRDSIEAAVVLLIAVLAAVVASRVLAMFARRFDRTDADLMDDLLRSARLPVVVLVLLAGLYVALEQFTSFDEIIGRYSVLFHVASVLVVLLGLTNAVNLGTMWYSRGVSADAHQSHVALLKKLAVLAIWVLGSIQILSALGVKVTAVLASLGIAGLAVGLALQDTIANLFAGFYLVADRSIRSGDYIKLENGDEGFVELVGWRNTRIRLWANNVVLIPNSKLTQSTITNMALPDPVLSVYTWGGVGYDSDLEHVEKVGIETAKEVLNNFPGGDMSYEPVLRFKEFGDSNIKFLVIFRAVDVGAQYLLQHEFIKALHRRFREEEIEISFPVRKLVWDGSKLPAHVESRVGRAAVRPDLDGGNT